MASRLSGGDERRGLLLDSETELEAAAGQFTAYALEECRLFLHRAAPTPIATVDAGIEVAPE